VAEKRFNRTRRRKCCIEIMARGEKEKKEQKKG
jgi:hypothetical protein